MPEQPTTTAACRTTDPSHGRGGQEWCETHDQLASRCAVASAAGPLFVSFRSAGGFGNAVLDPMAEPKSMDDIEAIQDRLRRELFGWAWRWRKVLLLTWKVLDAA